MHGPAASETLAVQKKCRTAWKPSGILCRSAAKTELCVTVLNSSSLGFFRFQGLNGIADGLLHPL
jgi:hypothetical protein